MRRSVLAVLIAVLLASPALGEEKKPAKAPPGTSVEMPFLIAPMSKDGKLLGYAYISSKVICSSGSATVAVRGKVAFIQDANVRDVNAHPVSRADDPTQVDDVALSLRLADNARRIVGGNKVVRVVFIAVQFAPLHPSQSTMGMVSSPDKVSALTQAAAKENQPATASAQPGTQPAAPLPAATSAKPTATSKP
jgi:hypothetical protein